MSRGFVKEDDVEHAGTDLPERPLSPHPNYVTPLGLQQLQAALRQSEQQRLHYQRRKEEPNAQQKLAEIERDIRYFDARLRVAQPVAAPQTPVDHVLFGATVTAEDADGQRHTFQIVGEDEADIAAQKVSYVSPLAKALLGRRLGDTTVWQRPAGALTLVILDIHY